jgi:SAM-dependent methyltransferase
MNRVDRAGYDQALLRARLSAYGPDEFVGQESFMRAGEILTIARRAGVAPDVSVLDLCCGVAGPGRWITRALGCRYLGVDSSPGAIAVARERAGGLSCRFQVAEIPPVPAGSFDVVLLLETMLAFRDKPALIRQVAGALSPGGRFAFTLEEGPPLTESERDRMPAAHTVWLTRAVELVDCLAQYGMTVSWVEDWTDAHRQMAEALTQAFAAEASSLVALLGPDPVEELLVSHRLWSTWLGAGRVRKLAFVAQLEPRLRTPALDHGCGP